MKHIITYIMIGLLSLGYLAGQDKNGTPNPHGLQLQYCYGIIKKAYNVSAGPHYLEVVRNMPHLVFWNHSSGVWATNYFDVKIFEEVSPGNWQVVQSYYNVDYLPMYGYTFPVLFTFTSTNLYKVEFYMPGTAVPLDINLGSQVYIRPHEISILVSQNFNNCVPPVYTYDKAIKYSLFPLNEHGISKYMVTNPAHNGYENIVDALWDFGKGAKTLLYQAYNGIQYPSFTEPFSTPAYWDLYDGTNDPCSDGIDMGECYTWPYSGPPSFCKNFNISASIWAYDLNTVNPNLDSYDPCIVFGKDEGMSKVDVIEKDNGLKCSHCISTSITVCKLCKPKNGDLGNDGDITVQVNPNLIRLEDLVHVDILNQTDINYISDISIVELSTGRVIHHIKGLVYSGPESLYDLSVDEPCVGVYKVNALSTTGKMYITEYIVD